MFPHNAVDVVPPITSLIVKLYPPRHGRFTQGPHPVVGVGVGVGVFVLVRVTVGVTVLVGVTVGVLVGVTVLVGVGVGVGIQELPQPGMFFKGVVCPPEA